LIAVIIAGASIAIGSAAQAGAQLCSAEVLYSEMLPVGPAFYYTIKATLLVAPTNRPPLEATVVRAIPWQAPPPRQGQRQRVPGDPALLPSSFLF
jgi:hypothetical protein